MSKHKANVNRGSALADPAPVRAGSGAKLTPDFVAVTATIGVIGAGVALFEAALISGIVIGGAAVLAPKYLPKLRRRLQPLFDLTARRRIEPAVPLPDRTKVEAPLAAPAGFVIKQALAKTITFRIIVTSLDFSWNYIVLGEVAAAAGLSAISLAVAPLFYFVHEMAWNYPSRSVKRKAGQSGTVVDLPVVTLRADAKAPQSDRGWFTIDRALAKTVTYRTIATTTDFATNYVVVGELGTAAALSAFGIVVGPFVYLGHEMAWDYYGSPKARALNPPKPTKLEPALV